MKGKIFSIVGLVMGCISVSISVTALVFSAIGMVKSKKIKAPRSFCARAFLRKGRGDGGCRLPPFYIIKVSRGGQGSRAASAAARERQFCPAAAARLAACET